MVIGREFYVSIIKIDGSCPDVIDNTISFWN